MKKPQLIPTKIRLLEMARKNIISGDARGLCYALTRGHSHFTSGEVIACADLKQYISDALRGHGWLEDWQEQNGLGKRGSSRAKQDRLDWIDWMIADYKKWGAK